VQQIDNAYSVDRSEQRSGSRRLSLSDGRITIAFAEMPSGKTFARNISVNAQEAGPSRAAICARRTSRRPRAGRRNAPRRTRPSLVTRGSWRVAWLTAAPVPITLMARNMKIRKGGVEAAAALTKRYRASRASPEAAFAENRKRTPCPDGTRQRRLHRVASQVPIQARPRKRQHGRAGRKRSRVMKRNSVRLSVYGRR
jgi:hypothetical protein